MALGGFYLANARLKLETDLSATGFSLEFPTKMIA
jgi:hypothetical protein